MTKIIYYCDLHQGRMKTATDITDVDLICQYAVDLNMAIFDYAHSNGISEVIHGGDESTFVKGDLSHHYHRAQIIAATMSDFPTDSLHRIIGNHEPVNDKVIGKKLDPFYLMRQLGFQANTYDKNLTSSRLIIGQPDITRVNGKNIYSYNEKEIAKLIPAHPPTEIRSVKRPNLVYASHWALDRLERGYPELLSYKGYGYQDNSALLKERFSEYAGGDMGRVLTLHAHEHRFSMSENLGFTCLVMPSISQVDIDDPGRPCGFFVEISDETPDGRLTFAFKKINLKTEDNAHGQSQVVADNDNYEIVDVERADMDRYFRPVLKKFG